MSVFVTLKNESIKHCRKPHLCSWCDGTIAAGQPAAYYAGTYYYGFQSTYMHPECFQAMRNDPDLDDELPADTQRRGLVQSETERWWNYKHRCEDRLMDRDAELGRHFLPVGLTLPVGLLAKGGGTQ